MSQLPGREVYKFIDGFEKLTEFLEFARVELDLQNYELNGILDDYKDSREQKFQIISLWKRKRGRQASMQRLYGLKQAFCEQVPVNVDPVDESMNPNQQPHPSGDTILGSTPPAGESQRKSSDVTPTVNENNVPSDDARVAAGHVENPQFRSDRHVMQSIVQEEGGQEDDSESTISSKSSCSTERDVDQETSASKVEAQNKATGNDDLAGIASIKPTDYFDICNDVPSTVEVEHCPTKYALDLRKTNKYYPILDKSYKGYILIFNNTFEGNPNHPKRKGSKEDVKNLKILWKEIGGCKVIVKNDLSAKKMKKEFQKFVTSKTRKDCGFVAFFIMSHGDCDYYMKDDRCQKGGGFFLGNDGEEVMIDDILEMLQNRYPETTLRNTPKLIFFQTCRGNRLDKGIENSTPYSSVETECPAQKQGSITVDGNTTETGEILQGYATQLGYQAMRDVKKGTWYINAIVNVFRQNAKTLHVLELLTEVNRAVSEMSDNLKNGDPCKEQSEMTSTLRRLLHFFPGQENEEY